MKVSRKLILLFVLSISGCGEENFTSGVSLGGSGTGSSVPDTGGTLPILPPLPIEVDDPKEEENYIIWSNDKKELNCGSAQLSIQLLHTQTRVPLELHQGTFISPTDEEHPTNVFLEIKLHNSGTKSVYEYFIHDQSNIELQNQDGITIPDHQYSSPTENIEIIEIKPLQTKTYIYELAAQLQENQWQVIYKPILSFGECEPLSYDIKIEKY